MAQPAGENDKLWFLFFTLFFLDN